MSKVVIVIPNHLPHLDFLVEWQQLRNLPLIIVQDIGEKPSVPPGFTDVTIFDHNDVTKDLGHRDWIIPAQSSACRSYGYLMAWRREPDFIVTLDNDCYPERSEWVQEHIYNLSQSTTLDWVNSGPGNVYYRGFPYSIRHTSPVMLSHGLWSGIPDLDGPTWLHKPQLRLEPETSTVTIPRWSFFPMCGMNLAWRAELTPAMYFGLFGPAYGFDQYDDIWAGILVKKILDHFGWAAVSGKPSVEHRKQSNVFSNIRKQAPGLQMNENFWRIVRDIELTETTVVSAYQQLIKSLPDTIDHEPNGWTREFKTAALIWTEQFK